MDSDNALEILAREAEAARTTQYLSFVCAGEEYGVEILRVQEIKGWEPVTRIPCTPSWLLGVMNLRGMIVPVIDMRLRLGLPQRPRDNSTVVVVVRARGPRGERTAGIVVDAVAEVYSLGADAIQITPGLGGQVDACVRSLATVEDKMLMLLDVDRFVNSCIDGEASTAVA
jgi:purine-binding chemotaxis protein CheW